MVTYVKDPNAKLDYGFDWTLWLAAGETVMTSTWTVPAGLSVLSSTHSENLTVVWLAEGVHGTNYEIVNHITTSQGREDDRSIRIQVRER